MTCQSCQAECGEPIMRIGRVGVWCQKCSGKVIAETLTAVDLLSLATEPAERIAHDSWDTIDDQP